MIPNPNLFLIPDLLSLKDLRKTGRGVIAPAIRFTERKLMGMCYGIMTGG